MRASYNVLDEPWIPVIDLHGSKMHLGIRDTFRLAHKLKEITIASPLEEYAVHRFLNVFLMDALRPKRNSAIRTILKSGAFDMEQLEQYISICQDEGVTFDVFDEKRPFMQSPYVAEWDKEPKPVASIDCYMPSGNNHLHFDHNAHRVNSIPVDRAFRLVLTVQQFCTAGAQNYPSGVNASPPFFAVAKGENLFETLVFSLIPTQSIQLDFDDPPVIWRETAQIQPKKEVGATSWLRGMYFPARRVQLIPPDEGVGITKVYLSQGENFKNKETWTDPFVTYRVLDTGRVPLRPNREKPVWRNLYDIIDIPHKHTSLALAHYVELLHPDAVHITLYGVGTNQASYLDVYRHDFILPVAIMEDEQSIDSIKKSIDSAESIARRLRFCIRNEDVFPEATAEKALGKYYAAVEKDLWELCDQIVRKEQSLPELYRLWCEKIKNHAQEVFTEVIMESNLRGRDLAKAAIHQQWLYSETKKLLEGATV